MSVYVRRRFWLFSMCFIVLSLFTLSLVQAQNQPVFRIGVLDTEDGSVTKGARLAVNEINGRGGITGADGTSFALELVIQPPFNLSESVNRINEASVIAVLGPEKSVDVLGNLPLLQTLQVPVLMPATDDTILALDTTDRIFRSRAQEVLLGRALANYLAEDVQPASLATIQLDLESTAGIVGFTTALSDMGIAPSQTFLMEAGTPIEDLAANVATANPQVVVTYGAPDIASLMYLALRVSGWEGEFVYNHAADPAFRSNVPLRQYAGIIGATTWTYAATDALSEAFSLGYVRAFGEIPNAVTASSYDSIYLLANAINLPGELLTNLTNLTEVAGVQGILSPASLIRGETSNNVFIAQTGIQGGQEVLARYAGNTRLPADFEIIGETPATATPLPPPPTATLDGVYVTITRAVQNVRSGPGTIYDVIGQLRQGDTARVIGANANLTWLVIDLRGVQGWLSRDILDVAGDLNSVPLIAPPPTPTAPPATLTPTTAPLPDVIVLSILPTRLTVGVPFNASVTLLNQGGANAGPFAVAATFQPGGIYAAVNLPGLGAGQQTTINLTGTLTGPTGLQNVVIVVDLNQEVNEGGGGEANNNFSYPYIADAPILSVNGTGALTVANTATVSLDNGTADIQWSGGSLVPQGTTTLSILGGFSSIDQVHKDAISASPLNNVPINTVPIGALIGVFTDGGAKYGVLQVTEATSGGNLVFNFRMYE